MPEFRIDYNFRGYGTTHIDANSEEEAREKWDNGEYETGNEETEDYEISEIAGPEELARERQGQESHGIIDNGRSSRDTENYCVCGNPVEEKGEVCDQCWAAKQT